MKKPALKTKWERCYPMGYEREIETGLFSTAIVFESAWAAISFFNNYSRWIDTLDGRNPQVLNFGDVLGVSFGWFPVVALLMLLSIAIHYAHHYSGSRSIYLMRRLPNRWELHRRCIAGPLIFLLISTLAAVILFFAFYAVYMLCTPEEWLTPGQLRKILMFWRVI